MPYDCHVCGKSFRYKVTQRTHKCIGSSADGLIDRPDLPVLPKNIQEDLQKLRRAKGLRTLHNRLQNVLERSAKNTPTVKKFTCGTVSGTVGRAIVFYNKPRLQSCWLLLMSPKLMNSHLSQEAFRSPTHMIGINKAKGLNLFSQISFVVILTSEICSKNH